jgi:hypothetical protein
MTFPFSLRFLLASRSEALTAMLAVAQRGISTFVVGHAEFTVSSSARTGAVALIQRFGSALNLNVHLHMLFLDGAYSFSSGRATIHGARRPTDRELAQLLGTLSRCIAWVLEQRGLLIADPGYPYLDLEPGSGLSVHGITEKCRVGLPLPLGFIAHRAGVTLRRTPTAARRSLLTNLRQCSPVIPSVRSSWNPGSAAC